LLPAETIFAQPLRLIEVKVPDCYHAFIGTTTVLRRSARHFGPISRDSFVNFNHLLLASIAAAVLSIGHGVSSAADEPQTAPSAQASKPPVRLLFVTESFEFKHDVVNRKERPLSIAERTMTDLGISSNLFRVDCSQDVAQALTKENLQNYDIVMFYTTGHRSKWPVDDATLDYLFKDWVKQKGHGFIGVHSAADTLEDYEPYWEMLGGSFNEHPWTSGSHVTVVVDDPNHPISKPWGKEFQITDEIYQFKHWQPEKVRVLMSLDIGRSDYNKHVKDTFKQFHVPIAWCKEYGKGKVFHMSLGHNEAVWLDPRYRDSLLGGIKWILGLEPGSATPNPEIEAVLVEKGKADAAAKLAEFEAKEAAKAAGKNEASPK
jgi:type 1 glutamine amidotransferase